MLVSLRPACAPCLSLRPCLEPIHEARTVELSEDTASGMPTPWFSEMRAGYHVVSRLQLAANVNTRPYVTALRDLHSYDEVVGTPCGRARSAAWHTHPAASWRRHL